LSTDVLLIVLTVNLLILTGAALYALYRLQRVAGPSTWSRVAWHKLIPVALFGVIVLYFLWRVRDLLTPFFIAFFLASLMDPVVTRLQHKWRYSRGRVVATIFVLVITLFMAAAVWIVPLAMHQMTQFASNSTQYSDKLTTEVAKYYDQYKGPLGAVGIKKNPLQDKSGPVATAVSKVLDSLKGALVGLAGQVLWIVIIPLSLFYFLLDYPLIRAKLISFISPRHQASVDRMSQEIVEIFSQYTRGLAKVCALYGLAAVLLFSLFRLPYALFLGMAAGVLYAVPYVGPALAMAGAAIITVTMGHGAGYAALVVTLFIVLHVSFDYGVTPKVVGGSVGLHPLVNIFALMVGATLFGVMGMLLAVPVAASIQMLLLYFFPKLGERPILATQEVTTPTPDEAVMYREEAPVA
jgi:predicted PurR-regulated permease PerM